MSPNRQSGVLLLDDATLSVGNPAVLINEGVDAF
jgi:hypothetical protein